MKKNFLRGLFLLVLVPFLVFGQATSTSTVTKSYTYAGPKGLELLTSVNIDISFSADSTLSQATATFTVPEYQGVDPVTNPIGFRLKAVGTYGTPNRFITLQGLFSSSTDTVSIDTVSQAAVNQTEGDTLGVLTLNQVKPIYGYKVFIRDITADINTGHLELVFPIPPEAKIYKQDSIRR